MVFCARRSYGDPRTHEGKRGLANTAGAANRQDQAFEPVRPNRLGGPACYARARHLEVPPTGRREEGGPGATRVGQWGRQLWQVPTSPSTRCCWRLIARPANWRTCVCYSRAASNWIFDLATGSKIFRSRIRSSTSNRHRAWPSSINPLHSLDLDRSRCAATDVELNRPSPRPKKGLHDWRAGMN